MVGGVNRDLFNLLIRHFFLSMVTISSTQFFTISEIVISEAIYVADRTGEFDFYYAAYIPFHILRSLDAVVSTCYIMLSLKNNTGYYNNLCGFCQRHCIVCWTRAIHIKMTSGTTASDSNAHEV